MFANAHVSHLACALRRACLIAVSSLLVSLSGAAAAAEPPQPQRTVELSVIARLHARAGQEAALAQALRKLAAPTRAEGGNVAYAVYRSTRDQRLFFMHSRWKDEASFDAHGDLPHTVQFIETVQPLIDQPFDVSRVRAMETLANGTAGASSP